MIVVIDDERTFTQPVDRYARTSDEGLGLLARFFTQWYMAPYGGSQPIEELWLDHDLGNGDDIRPVVDFLISLGDATDYDDGHGSMVSGFISNIYVHSQNPTVDWMIGTLSEYYPNVKRVPLPEMAV